MKFPSMLKAAALFPLGWWDLAVKLGIANKSDILNIADPVRAMARVRELLDIKPVAAKAVTGLRPDEVLSAILK